MENAKKILTGEYFHQIDQKGRLRIPARLKTALGNGFMATKGTAGCVFLFSEEELRTTVLDKINNVPLSDLEAARPLRLIFSSAQELEEDNQGRVLLPKNLREFAKIQKDIVFLGVGNHAEIWSKEEYDRYINGADFDKAFAGLKEYGV